MSKRINEIFFLILFLFIYTNSEIPYTKNFSDPSIIQQNNTLIISSTIDNSETFNAYKKNEGIFLNNNKGSNEKQIKMSDTFEGFSDIFKVSDFYFLCPKGKNQVPSIINSDFTSVSLIDNFKEKLDKEQNEYQLRCFRHTVSSTQLIFIGLVDYLDSKRSNYVIGLKYEDGDKGLVPLDDPIIEQKQGKVTKDYGSFTYGDEYYLMFISNSKEDKKNVFNLSVNKYKSLSSSTICSNSYEGNLYSIVRLKYIQKKIFFFSYDPQTKNYISGYQNFDGCDKNNNNYYIFDFFPMLLESDDFVINSIEFYPEENHYAYFMVTSTKEVKQCIGIIDVLYNIIILNYGFGANTIRSVISSMKISNISQKFAVLSLNKENSYGDICPFSGDTNSKCGFDCKESIFFKLSLKPVCKAKSAYILGDKYSLDDYCPIGYTLDETKKECKHCDDYYSFNGCLKTCELKKLGKFCYNCSDLNQYSYRENECIFEDKCPKNAVKDTENKVCLDCQYLGKVKSGNKCEDKCEQGYYNNNGVCELCQKYIYGEQCLEECPPGTESNKSKVCESKCQFECLNEGVCDKEVGKCVCQKGFSGTYCEIESIKDVISSEDIKIYTKGDKVLKNKINVFGYETTISFPQGYDITWKVTDEIKKEEIDFDNYLNGVHEETLKLSANTFDSIEKARIMLTLLDRATSKEISSLIELSFSAIEAQNFEVSITYPENSDSVVSMVNKVKISVTIPPSKRLRRLSKEYNLLYYQFSYIDINGEEIPLSIDEKKKESNEYNGPIPFTSAIVVTITDSKGQSVKIKKDINVLKDPNYSKDLKQILDSTMDQYEKILEVYNNIVHNIDKEFSTETIKLIATTLDDDKNPNDNKVVLAILNYLIKDGKIQDTSELESIMNKMIEGLGELTYEDEERLKSFYRNIDVSLSKTVLNSDNNPDLNVTKHVEKTKESIKKLNELLMDTLEKGEKVQIDTSTFKAYIEKPGRAQDSITIGEDEDETKTYSKYSDYSITHKNKNSQANPSEDECGNSSFCVTKDNYKMFKNDLNIKNGDSDAVAISVVKINNTSIYKERGYKPMTSSSVVSSVYTNNNENKDIPIAYSLSLQLSPEYNLNEINAGSVCVPISAIKNPRISCKTYFNYKTNRTICKCKNTGEVAGLFDETLANFYKLLQFPKLSVDMINPLSAAFICCSLMIIIVFSIGLLVYDYIDDKNEMVYIEMTEAQKVKKELDEVKGLKDTKIFGLAWFVTQNVFPFFEMVYIYNYKQPRYIRFVIQMISMMVSLLFSIIPYYKTKFTYKEIFIDERDIEKESWDVNNLPTKLWDVISGLIYSIAASISIIIVVSIFSFLLKFKALLLETWKYRKKIILGYIRKNLIRNEVIKMKRMRTKIYAVCAFIDIYSKLKAMKEKKHFKSIGSKEHLNDSTDENSDAMIQIRFQKKRKTGLSRKNLRGVSEESRKSVFFIERSAEGYINVKSTDSQAREEKLREKIHEIKRRYTITEDFVMKGVKTNLKRKSKIISKGYDYNELAVGSNLYNYSFFNIKENMTKRKEDYTDKIDMIKTVIASLLMMGILGLIYYYLIIMFADIYERYHFYIVKVWLLPSLINLTLVRLATSYVQNLIYILVVIFFYEKRYNTTISKFLFKFIIPKYLIYTYKVQMMLNKYHDMLEKDLELKCAYKKV